MSEALSGLRFCGGGDMRLARALNWARSRYCSMVGRGFAACFAGIACFSDAIDVRFSVDGDSMMGMSAMSEPHVSRCTLARCWLRLPRVKFAKASSQSPSIGSLS